MTSLLSTTTSSPARARSMPRFTLEPKPRFSAAITSSIPGSAPSAILVLRCAGVIYDKDADAFRVDGPPQMPDRVDGRVRRTIGRDHDRHRSPVLCVPGANRAELRSFQQADPHSSIESQEPQWRGAQAQEEFTPAVVLHREVRTPGQAAHLSDASTHGCSEPHVPRPAGSNPARASSEHSALTRGGSRSACAPSVEPAARTE